MRRGLLVAFVFQCCFIASDGAPPSRADDLATKLSKRVTNYNLGVFTFPEALIRVSNDYQIAMGIAWVNNRAGRTELPFTWKNATVREIIEAIAQSQPGYDVQFKNGIVRVSPNGLISDRENFLKMKIDAFNVHDTYIELASFKLHTLVTPMSGNRQFSIAGPGDSRVSVELRHSTVESALDALAIASNRKVWIVTFSDDAPLTSRGLRRTISLWSDKPQPDDEQPGWDLQRWGDPTPPLLTKN